MTPEEEVVLDNLTVVKNFLDWQYAIKGASRTEDFHRQLVGEQRPMPTLDEARSALARVEREVRS